MMNKRIHELVRQCGGYHIDDDGEEDKTAVLVGKDVELFAELIIRECMSLTERCLDGNDVFALNGAEIIADHFGVEE